MDRNELKMRLPNRTLEEVLQHFFGCKKPFAKNGDFTAQGSKAYGKLVELLYNVGILAETDMNDIIESLDYIVTEKY